jgi:hypothetical protein
MFQVGNWDRTYIQNYYSGPHYDEIQQILKFIEEEISEKFAITETWQKNEEHHNIQ